MHSCLYEGRVRHRRFSPVEHGFSYSLFLVYLDLAELDSVFRGRWLWSTSRPAPARFRRDDHLGDPATPLDEAVRDFVASETGDRPEGPIRLLTHLRYFGYVINPVSFYYCFDAKGAKVRSVVAEVTNTPWGERHCYVLRGPAESESRIGWSAETEKQMHVSPFLPMDMQYEWWFTPPGARLGVQMDVERNGERVLHADLSLRRREMTAFNLSRALVRFPLMTARVAAAIYWQALRLKLKGAPFHAHPQHAKQPERVLP